MSKGRPIGQRKRELFLNALQETAQVKLSAERAGCIVGSLYFIRKREPEFAAAWAEALQIGLDRLEDEAVRRAMDGTEEPVFYQGQQVGTVQKYSDRMLTVLLKAHRPERYGDKVDVGVSDELKRLLGVIDQASPVTLDGEATVVTDDEG